MKKLFLSLLFVFIVSALFAFPNKTVKMNGDEVFSVQNNEIVGYGEFRIFIQDTDLVTEDSVEIGTLFYLKEYKCYALSIEFDELSFEALIDGKTFNITNYSEYDNAGNVILSYTFDSKTGYVTSSVDCRDEEIDSQEFFYFGKSKNIKKAVTYYKDNSTLIYEYDKKYTKEIISVYELGDDFKDVLILRSTSTGDILNGKISRVVKEYPGINTYQYDYNIETGNVIRSVVFDKDNSIIQDYNYEYLPDGKIKNIIRDKDGNIISQEESFVVYGPKEPL